MRKYQSKNIQIFLENIVRDVKPIDLSKLNMFSFKDDLERYFNNISGEILEYQKHAPFVKGKEWIASDRNPLTFNYVDIIQIGDVVSLNFKKSNDSSVVGIYFHFNSQKRSEISFLGYDSFYVASFNLKGKLSENVYVPLNNIKNL